MHGGIEAANAGLARRLGGIHRAVRVAKQRQLVVFRRGNGNANAHVDGNLPATKVHRHAQQREESRGECLEIIVMCAGLTHHGELVTAEAGNGFTGPHRTGNAASHNLQELVANRVAKRIVHVLESIQIEQEHRHAAVSTAASRQGMLEAITEQHAIGQPRELVLERLFDQLTFHHLALRDVLNHGDHPPTATLGQTGDSELSPHNVPVFVKEAALGGDGVTCAGSELPTKLPAELIVVGGRERNGETPNLFCRGVAQQLLRGWIGLENDAIGREHV